MATTTTSVRATTTTTCVSSCARANRSRGATKTAVKRRGAVRAAAGGDDDAEHLRDGSAHAAYVRDAANAKAPAELEALVRVLEAQGCALVRPNARRGLHPLVMPLAKTGDGEDETYYGLMMVEGTAGGDAAASQAMPVVRVRGGVHATLVGKSASEFVHRAIVEEEARSDEKRTVVAAAAGAVGVSLHNHGAFTTSGKEFDVYVTTQIGKFPSSMEGLVKRHLDRGDEQSALITCDLYKSTFGEWGAPHVFISDLYAKLGRDEEARDAARHALQTPWSTIGGAEAIERMIRAAGWEGKNVAEIKEVLESRRGPSAAAFDGPKSERQLAREESELLLDQLAAGEIEAATVNQRLAECYMNAGKPTLAKFIMCGSMPAGA